VDILFFLIGLDALNCDIIDCFTIKCLIYPA